MVSYDYVSRVYHELQTRKLTVANGHDIDSDEMAGSVFVVINGTHALYVGPAVEFYFGGDEDAGPKGITAELVNDSGVTVRRIDRDYTFTGDLETDLKNFMDEVNRIVVGLKIK